MSSQANNLSIPSVLDSKATKGFQDTESFSSRTFMSTKKPEVLMTGPTGPTGTGTSTSTGTSRTVTNASTGGCNRGGLALPPNLRKMHGTGSKKRRAFSFNGPLSLPSGQEKIHHGLVSSPKPMYETQNAHSYFSPIIRDIEPFPTLPSPPKSAPDGRGRRDHVPDHVPGHRWTPMSTVMASPPPTPSGELATFGNLALQSPMLSSSPGSSFSAFPHRCATGSNIGVGFPNVDATQPKTVPPPRFRSSPGQFRSSPSGQFRSSPSSQFRSSPPGQFRSSPPGQFRSSPPGQFRSSPPGQFRSSPRQVPLTIISPGEQPTPSPSGYNQSLGLRLKPESFSINQENVKKCTSFLPPRWKTVNNDDVLTTDIPLQEFEDKTDKELAGISIKKYASKMQNHRVLPSTTSKPANSSLTKFGQHGDTFANQSDLPCAIFAGGDKAPSSNSQSGDDSLTESGDEGEWFFLSNPAPRKVENMRNSSSKKPRQSELLPTVGTTSSGYQQSNAGFLPISRSVLSFSCNSLQGMSVIHEKKVLPSLSPGAMDLPGQQETSLTTSDLPSSYNQVKRNSSEISLGLMLEGVPLFTECNSRDMITPPVISKAPTNPPPLRQRKFTIL